jgi:3-oxoacyl-[acyl-carrier protein] reductase
MFDLTGKIALVTGASGTLGRAIAIALADSGADVACHCNENKESAEKLSFEIIAKGRRSVSLSADLTDPEEADRIIEETVSRLGDIHILVNNAGVNREALLIRQSPLMISEILASNLASMMFVSRAASRRMAKNHWGRSIHIGSVVAHTGSTAQTAYAASKAGVEGMSRAIARELGGRNITSNVVAPGLIEGGMTDQMSDERRSDLMSYIALGRAGRPEDVGAAVVYIASDEAAYITGTVLHINGGIFMP